MNRLLLTMCTVMVSGMLSVSASGASKAPGDTVEAAIVKHVEKDHQPRNAVAVDFPFVADKVGTALDDIGLMGSGGQKRWLLLQPGL